MPKLDNKLSELRTLLLQKMGYSDKAQHCGDCRHFAASGEQPIIRLQHGIESIIPVCLLNPAVWLPVHSDGYCRHFSALPLKVDPVPPSQPAAVPPVEPPVTSPDITEPDPEVVSEPAVISTVSER